MGAHNAGGDGISKAVDDGEDEHDDDSDALDGNQSMLYVIQQAVK